MDETEKYLDPQILYVSVDDIKKKISEDKYNFKAFSNKKLNVNTCSKSANEKYSSLNSEETHSMAATAILRPTMLMSENSLPSDVQLYEETQAEPYTRSAFIETPETRRVMSCNDSDFSSLKNVVYKLEHISEQLASAARADQYEHFGKYLAALLRGIPHKKFLFLKQKFISDVIQANSPSQVTVNDTASACEDPLQDGSEVNTHQSCPDQSISPDLLCIERVAFDPCNHSNTEPLTAHSRMPSQPTLQKPDKDMTGNKSSNTSITSNLKRPPELESVSSEQCVKRPHIELASDQVKQELFTDDSDVIQANSPSQVTVNDTASACEDPLQDGSEVNTHQSCPDQSISPDLLCIERVAFDPCNHSNTEPLTAHSRMPSQPTLQKPNKNMTGNKSSNTSITSNLKRPPESESVSSEQCVKRPHIELASDQVKQELLTDDSDDEIDVEHVEDASQLQNTREDNDQSLQSDLPQHESMKATPKYCQNIALADTNATLEKEMSRIIHEIQCLVSPKAVKVAFPALENITNSDDSDADPDYQQPSDTEANVLKMKGKRKQIDTTNMEEKREKEKLKTKFKLLEEEKVILKEETNRLRRQLVEEIPTMLAAMQKACQPTQGAGPSSNTSSFGNEQRLTGQVEIIAGSGVYLDASSWLSAKACSTAGSFVGRLLVSLFDHETLLRSNLKGGAPKFGERDQQERREKLDSKIIAAIKGAARIEYPELKEAQFGTFVNQKIANLRSKAKKDLRQEQGKENDLHTSEK